MKCDKCEHLLDYPIPVIDEKKKLMFGVYDYHWEDGYKCTWNGAEGLTKEELVEVGCNKIIDGE